MGDLDNSNELEGLVLSVSYPRLYDSSVTLSRGPWRATYEDAMCFYAAAKAPPVDLWCTTAG